MKNLIVTLVIMAAMVASSNCFAQKKGIRMARYEDMKEQVDVYSGSETLNTNLSSGYYLQKSALHFSYAIGCTAVGGALMGGLSTSKNSDVRTAGYIAGGVSVLTGIGFMISGITNLNHAGKMLDIQLNGRTATLGLNDSATGIKLTF